MPHMTVDVVLAAVDFNEISWENTVRHAAHQAAVHDARLHLVTVTEKPHWLIRQVMDDKALQVHLSSVEAVATERLDAAAALATEGTSVSKEVRTGKPAVQLLASIKEQNADLLVVGTRPITATSMVIAGTTDRLLRSSPIPVFVAGPAAPRPIRNVLVPTGLGPSGAFALSTAVEQLSDTSGEVKALYMVALPSVMTAYSGDVLKLRRDIEAAARVEFDAHVAGVDLAEGYAPIVRKLVANLEIAPANDTIVEEAGNSNSDLICFALGGRGRGPGQLIGRISERVMRVTPCSVLALPDHWIAQNKG
ncbi:MAG: universal stress protein [Proteobacteria bacterium]|nr:universal stress protein [Pseudomonadota bacterium]